MILDLHPSCLCASTCVVFCCGSVFANTIRACHRVLVFPWLHDCINHNGPKLQTEEFFSYDSMWDSRCVDVFSEREVTQLAPHTALQPPNVVHVSASELKLLRTLVVQQHWAHGLHSLGRAWQAPFVSTDETHLGKGKGLFFCVVTGWCFRVYTSLLSVIQRSFDRICMMCALMLFSGFVHMLPGCPLV